MLMAHAARVGLLAIWTLAWYLIVCFYTLQTVFVPDAAYQYIRILGRNHSEQNIHFLIVLISVAVSAWCFYGDSHDAITRVSGTSLMSGIMAAVLFSTYEPLYPALLGDNFSPALWFGFVPVSIETALFASWFVFVRKKFSG